MSQPTPIRVGLFSIDTLSKLAERSQFAQVACLHDLAHGIKPPTPLVPTALDQLAEHYEARAMELAGEGIDPTAADLSRYWAAVTEGGGYEAAVTHLVQQDDPQDPQAPSPS